MFEDELSRGVLSQSSEKSFVDKVLARSDVEHIKDLMAKDSLTRSDMLELLYMLSANETKLWNFGEYNRYISAKYFVWIREFVKIAELLYDYDDDLNTKDVILKKEDDERASNDLKLKKSILSDRARHLLDNGRRLIQHNVKFLVDLYFNLNRTTLSLGAAGFMETLKNKYEFSYPQGQGVFVPVGRDGTAIRGSAK